MRLVGAMTIRDGADIVEACIRHNLVYLDGIAVVDHGSFDGTSSILAAMVREGLPVFVADDDTPGFDQATIINRLVRHVFGTSDADWVFPLDCDEFLKARSRQDLEANLHAVPPNRHLQLSWLTYVPRFHAGDDLLTLLRTTQRLKSERHGLLKMVVGRHILFTQDEQLAMGNHAIHRASALVRAPPDLRCAPDQVALAHVPIRSAAQFTAKMAAGWLSTLAADVVRNGEATHWREAFEYLRSGRPVTRGQLMAFALNYGIPQQRWLPADAIELVDDPFLADIQLTHEHFGIRDPLALVLAVAERLVKKA